MTLQRIENQKVLFAASLVSMVLGSIHAFSVFLEPLETMFGASRATVSLMYSFGLVFLTAAVLFGPTVYARLHPAIIFVCVALLGGLGLSIASLGGDLNFVFFGFSIVFGVANGLGYGFGLQFAARANLECPGLAMGVVTAAYALGAVLAPYGFDLALEFGGFAFAMMSFASVTFTVGCVAAVLVSQSGVRYSDRAAKGAHSALPRDRIATIWIAYGAGVAAGLMTISHAAGIAEAADVSGWIAVAVVAACNLFGSLLGGWLSDRVSHRKLLIVLPVLSGVGLVLLALLPAFSVIFLGIVGFAYGGTIAIYPAAISKHFPGENGPRAYGRVFTAWGAAGLCAPWFAGWVYDWSEGYALAFWFAVVLCAISALVARRAIQ